MALLDRRITRLASAEGFAEAVDENIKRYGGVEASFAEQNRLYEKYFGEPRYSGYDSYRTARRGRKKKAVKLKK